MQVVFTNLSIFNVDEDFFLQEMGRQTLPLASQVQRLKDFQAQIKNQNKTRIGLYQPYIWTAGSLLRALSYHQKVKVVLSLCDPVDRFEKRLHAMKALEASGLNSDSAMKAAFYQELTDEFSGPGMVHQWKRWLDVLGNRLLLVEKTLLSSANTFQRLADFLKIRRFASKAEFHRYNSRGTRSPFCEYKDLVLDLKERFTLEYEFLQSLDDVRTPSIEERSSQCERSFVRQRRSCTKERCSEM